MLHFDALGCASTLAAAFCLQQHACTFRAKPTLKRGVADEMSTRARSCVFSQRVLHACSSILKYHHALCRDLLAGLEHLHVQYSESTLQYMYMYIGIHPILVDPHGSICRMGLSTVKVVFWHVSGCCISYICVLGSNLAMTHVEQ